MQSNSTRNLNAVWGNAQGSRFFAVGDYGTVLYYNGSKWSQMVSKSSIDFNDIWGTSENDLYAVGSATQDGSVRYYSLYHYNGISWSRVKSAPQVPAGKTGKLRAIWGTVSGDFWVAGDDGVILRYADSQWTTHNSNTNAYCTTFGGLTLLKFMRLVNMELYSSYIFLCLFHRFLYGFR